MKVVILCGGQGTRLREETEIKPKPMIEIGSMPILWHIMKTYAFYGYTDFVLCLGYKSHLIKEFFYNYEMIVNDFTLTLGGNNVTIHPKHLEKGWKVTLAETGNDTMTGARIKKIEKYIDCDDFMLTYGDGVTDLNIKDLVDFHKEHGRIGTVTGVSPVSQYGELSIEDNKVISFSEKPLQNKASISGGYFVFNKKIFNYLTDDDSCVFERKPLQKLSEEGELNVYRHEGFWQCMDTYRDYKYLKDLWSKGNALWKKC